MAASPLASDLAPNIGFVHLDHAAQLLGECWIRQGVTNPVHHKQRRPIAAKSEHPLNLKRADALFGTAKQIPRNQPLSERNVRILENRPDRDRELLFALRALIKT